jgi:Transglutaminase-like superfamily
MGTPLLSGDAGVAQTIGVMRQIVDDAVKDPAVNGSAIQFVRGVSDSFSRGEKAQAIYAAVANRWLYVEDPVGPFGPKETLRPVRLLLQTFAGDCDDATILICALCGTIGIPCRIVTIAADPSSPREFSHVYPEAEIAPGQFVAMDVARPGSAYGVAPPRYFRKRVWSLESKTYSDLAGADCGCSCGGKCGGKNLSRLNGYAMLGDDTAFSIDAQAAASVESGVAQIISASKGQPTIPFNYPTGSSPYSTFTPAGAIPPAGYGVPSASVVASPGMLAAIVIGLGLAFALSRRR